MGRSALPVNIALLLVLALRTAGALGIIVDLLCRRSIVLFSFLTVREYAVNHRLIYSMFRFSF
jgi:hypothetical protein